MRILFADKFPEQHMAEIQHMGTECVFKPELTADELPSVIGGFDCLIVRSTRVTAETIEAGNDLDLVIRAGAGTNTIDTQAAADRGIFVCNVPGKNAIAVAELTFGLIAAIDRNIPDQVADLRNGVWDKKRWAQADGLYGKTIGIVGLGEIGLAVAARARAFGLEVYAIRKPNRDPVKLQRIHDLDIRLVSDLRLLARSCDILSFHVPVSDETVGLISKEVLSEMRPRSVLINTSRGELIDEVALLEAIEERDLRVGLDVFPDEPAMATGEFLSELANHPNVYGTHHIGASTEQAQHAIASEVVRILQHYGEGTVLHAVNMTPGVLGTSTLAVRHFDRVGVLSQIFDVLKNAGINVEQMQNQVFAGAKAAVATIRTTGDLTQDVLDGLRSIADGIHVAVRQ